DAGGPRRRRCPRAPTAAGRARLNPLDARDRLCVTQRGDDRVKVREVVHLDIEMEGLKASVAVRELKVDDVGVLCTQNARHCSERTWNISENDRQPSGAAVRAFTPGEVEPVRIDPA